MRHHVFDDMDKLLDKAAQLNFEGKNVFFALAGYHEPKVWNPSVRNKDGSSGKWQTRTQSNAGWLRTLFLDLDIDPTPDEKKVNLTYPSKQLALQSLRDFCHKINLPLPLTLDSGGGIHVYWPFDRDLTKDEWLALAEKFKAICLQESLKIDAVVPADSARVLRVLGCHNLKKPEARPVHLLHRGKGPFTVEQIETVFELYEQQHGVVQLPKKAKTHVSGVSSGEEGNLQKHIDPIDFGAMSFACAALGEQIACRGAGAPEPLWRFMLGLAKHATANVHEAMLCVSDGHADFDVGVMQAKANGWNAGPTKCTSIHKYSSECASCPHWGKITSPAQLAHAIIEVPPPPVEFVDEDSGEVVHQQQITPPFPYLLTENGVVMETCDKDGNKDYLSVCPRRVYPAKIVRHVANGTLVEETLWRVHLAREGWTELRMPQQTIAELQGLQKFLLGAGVYVTGSETKALQLYMSAYLKKLSEAQDRERVYDRLGWQGEDHKDGFVIGTRIINHDSSLGACHVTDHVKHSTKGKRDFSGSLHDWSQALKFYEGGFYQGHRFFLYMAMGAPIFHMTGHKGMMVHACGESGRGKTTCLDACGSIWAHPEALRVNGNTDGTTVNALINLIGTYHSLPVLLDEITSQDDKVMGEFALNISQGRGKERMKGHEHAGKTVTWETPILSTANTDLVARIFAGRKDAQPHMMRVVSVDFYLPDSSPEAINRANDFARAIRANYGHAGVLFLQYVVRNYDKIKARVEAMMAHLNTAIAAQSMERFWIAAIATAVIAGKIANHLKLWDFPVDSDFEWMKDHIAGMREVHEDHHTTPLEALSEFLESHIDNTLILSSKAASNLDNVARAPHRSLTVRHEFDKQTIFIARTAMQEFLLKTRISMRDVEHALTNSGVLISKNRQKVLGADTPFAKAQTRCWVVNAACLGPAHAALVSNVIQQTAAVLKPTGT